MWNSVFRSKQFLFVVGKDQTEFAVHSAIIAKQSKALDVLINGPMAEASDGRAVLKDVDEDTFIRFCQFAYTGDYVTPESTPPRLLSFLINWTVTRQRLSQN